MPNIVVRILAACLAIPAAVLIFLFAYMRFSSLEEMIGLSAAGLCAWAVVAVAWALIWTGVVRWTTRRVLMTAAVAAVMVAVVGLLILLTKDYWFSDYARTFTIGLAVGTITPLAWLASTLWIWRETPSERTLRLTGGAALSVRCPKCRYDLGAQHEAACPECGARYTIAALIAQQPADAPTEIERLLR